MSSKYLLRTLLCFSAAHISYWVWINYRRFSLNLIASRVQGECRLVWKGMKLWEQTPVVWLSYCSSRTMRTLKLWTQKHPPSILPSQWSYYKTASTLCQADVLNFFCIGEISFSAQHSHDIQEKFYQFCDCYYWHSYPQTQLPANVTHQILYLWERNIVIMVNVSLGYVNDGGGKHLIVQILLPVGHMPSSLVRYTNLGSTSHAWYVAKDNRLHDWV